MPNDFYIQPVGDWGTGLMGLGQSLGQAVKQREERQGFKNAQTKENYIQSLFQAIQDPERIPDIANQRKSFLESHGLTPDEMIHTTSAAERYQQDPEGFVNMLKQEIAYLAPERWEKYQNAIGEEEESTPATDIDDFVKDADAESIRLTGKGLTPGDRNKARLQFKRAQAQEVTDTKFAEKYVDMMTAEKIRFNEQLGRNLAEISTAGDLIKAKGEITPEAKKEIAKKRMAGNLSKLAKHYIDLDSSGAILNTENNTIQNIGAALRSSSMGQQLGRITGSDEQSIRESIKKLKPLLIQDIRQSTDMGARGLDSEKELEFYLQAATNEKTDIQSNIAAIVVLDEAFGNGDVAAQLRNLTNEDYIKRISDTGSTILNGFQKQPEQELKPISKEEAISILQEAGGDKDKAREIARQRNYKF